ncbi:MAG: hypothetical protein ABW352_04025 [Polyangiales bacterium]
MSRLPSLFAALALFGCESQLLVNEPLPHVDAGLFGDAGRNTRRDAAAPKPDEEEEPVEGEEEEPVEGEEEPVEGEDASKPATGNDAAVPESDGGGGEEPPLESKIAGSGLEAKCSSYGTAKGGMCAGYYCGITIETLAAEYKPGNKCDTTPEKICDGQLTRDVAKCARDTKSNPLNALDTTEQIREKTATCIMKIPANADTEPDCLDCFLDAAQCASDNCLTQCLTGDSATCDKCRLDNDCNQPVPSCAGFPTPF